MNQLTLSQAQRLIHTSRTCISIVGNGEFSFTHNGYLVEMYKCMDATFVWGVEIDGSYMGEVKGIKNALDLAVKVIKNDLWLDWMACN